VLDELDQSVAPPELREHVTLAMYRSPDRYRIGGVRNHEDWSSLRWTVDEPADLTLLQEIYAIFGDRPFSWLDVLRAHQANPAWQGINSHIVQKAA
jgi:spore coat polysaccharide biosynthesis protein SpsF